MTEVEMPWIEYSDDQPDQAKNPVDARRRALDQLDSAVRGEYKIFFCDLCLCVMPCDCGDLSDDDVATQAKYDAHNAAVEELIAFIEKLRGAR